MSRQHPVPARAGDCSLLAPTWHVTITTRRNEWEAPPTVSASIEADAEALGVDLRLDSHRCIAQFFARGASLEAATKSAFERWDLVRYQLCLPEWRATSLVVAQALAETSGTAPGNGRLHCQSARVRRGVSGPSSRYPYYLWSPS